MATYDSNHVKNIALLGHPGSGKTTLAESMLFESGLIKRRGSVIAKNTVSDYHELETERQSSVFSSLMHTVWRDYKINIIDTPGYDDFSGELISALRVADTGLLILNAAVGVEVGTDVIWEYTDNFKTPTVFVVNQIDKEAADFDKADKIAISVEDAGFPLVAGDLYKAIATAKADYEANKEPEDYSHADGIEI